MSDAERRVRAALSFQPPDRVPRYDSFWPEFTDNWRQQKALGPDSSPEDYYGIDLTVVAADETPWPSLQRVEWTDGDETVSWDGWGRRTRTLAAAKFSETLTVALPESRKLPELPFESPSLPDRYRGFLAGIEREHPRRAVFAKTGGPFLRTANLRGEVEWLMDLAGDEAYARELAGLLTRHLTAVGVESLRLGGERLSGIWIYDDIGANAGPMVSPRTFERVFLPLMAEMVSAYKEAGADFVVFHSDGNILPLVDMLVEAGVDAIQPIEPKAGMDILSLRERYGDRLALIGGLDNAFALPRGDREAIAAGLKRALAAGKEGGLILGTHSIGPDIAVETYDYLHRLEEEWGRYPLGVG
jgi:uroporphyrinogen decarboxylase